MNSYRTSLNALKTLIDTHQPYKIFELFKKKNINPGVDEYKTLLKACELSRQPNKAKKIMAYARKNFKDEKEVLDELNIEYIGSLKRLLFRNPQFSHDSFTVNGPKIIGSSPSKFKLKFEVDQLKKFYENEVKLVGFSEESVQSNVSDISLMVKNGNVNRINHISSMQQLRELLRNTKSKKNMASLTCFVCDLASRNHRLISQAHNCVEHFLFNFTSSNDSAYQQVVCGALLKSYSKLADFFALNMSNGSTMGLEPHPSKVLSSTQKRYLRKLHFNAFEFFTFLDSTDRIDLSVYTSFLDLQSKLCAFGLLKIENSKSKAFQDTVYPPTAFDMNQSLVNLVNHPCGRVIDAAVINSCLKSATMRFSVRSEHDRLSLLHQLWAIWNNFSKEDNGEFSAMVVDHDEIHSNMHDQSSSKISPHRRKLSADKMLKQALRRICYLPLKPSGSSEGRDDEYIKWTIYRTYQNKK